MNDIIMNGGHDEAETENRLPPTSRRYALAKPQAQPPPNAGQRTRPGAPGKAFIAFSEVTRFEKTGPGGSKPASGLANPGDHTKVR